MTESHGMIDASSSSQQIRRIDDLWSRSYDLVAGPFERKFICLGVKRATLQPHGKAFEVAMGTGTALREIAGQIELDRKICGIDLSPECCSLPSGSKWGFLAKEG